MQAKVVRVDVNDSKSGSLPFILVALNLFRIWKKIPLKVFAVGKLMR